MTKPPTSPKVYHITHIKNLPGMINEGLIQCDAEMVRRGGPQVVVGMSDIKRARLEQRRVTCYKDVMVGDFVPFYFCPRSVMLYLLHKGNHPGLDYHEGQGPIVHLQADLHETIDWLNAQGQSWAFSLSNAGAKYTEFRRDLRHLDEIDWNAVRATIWRDDAIKEGKQAEFLAYQTFPFSLIKRIGFLSRSTEVALDKVLAPMTDPPVIAQDQRGTTSGES